VTVHAGDGFDTLDVDWADKTISVRDHFDVRNGAAQVFLDDLAGNQIRATEIEKLIVRFGSGEDQFTVGGASRAQLDGGPETEIVAHERLIFRTSARASGLTVSTAWCTVRDIQLPTARPRSCPSCRNSCRKLQALDVHFRAEGLRKVACSRESCMAAGIRRLRSPRS